MNWSDYLITNITMITEMFVTKNRFWQYEHEYLSRKFELTHISGTPQIIEAKLRYATKVYLDKQ